MATTDHKRALRSQPTRDRIIESARAVFAREGYEGATIRTIAEEARVHPSMLGRYYGNKEQLFAVAARIDLRLPNLAHVAPDIVGKLLASHFVSRWEGEGGDGQLQALLRASVSHETARLKITEIFDEQVKMAVGSVKGIDQPATRAAMIASQLLGIAFGRHIVCLPSLTALEARDLIDWIGNTIQSYLDCPLANPTENP